MNLTTIEDLLITYPIRNVGPFVVFYRAVAVAAFLCGKGESEVSAVRTVADAVKGLEPVDQMRALLAYSEEG